jgi:hypothetical protein
MKLSARKTTFTPHPRRLRGHGIADQEFLRFWWQEAMVVWIFPQIIAWVSKTFSRSKAGLM